jgi:DNA invertase Pin-like site-specific DNA recombinase
VATFGYCRVSTSAQAENGESLAVQRRQIAGYAQMQGLHLSRIYVESGVSGSVPLGERPQGRDLLARLKSGDTVIMAKLDRAFRSAFDALKTLQRLKEQNIDLIIIEFGGSVTSNGVSKLLFTILSAVAELERERIRERIRDVKRDQRERGVYSGSVPFGYVVGDDRKLVPDPKQQAAFAEVYRLRKEGLSYHRIAAELRAHGIRISHSTVSSILSGRVRAHAA